MAASTACESPQTSICEMMQRLGIELGGGVRVPRQASATLPLSIAAKLARPNKPAAIGSTACRRQ